ncbi:MAG: DDE-type integrase/transposase/recombinase [Clostridia bacterium]
MKYAIIKKHTGKRRLRAACRLLNVRRRYCAWAAREQERPVRVRRDEALTRTDEGWLYLCTVLDICSRRVIGWAVSETIDRHLASAALEKALKARKPRPGFIFHSDRGSQYASSDFRGVVVRHGGLQRMSGPGSPYDHACAESFFRSVKVECVDATHFATTLPRKSNTAPRASLCAWGRC